MNRPANIVLLTIDSLRADRLGCYDAGGQGTLTPNLDALGSQGAIFEQAYAQGPFTAFSVPSLFTGKYPCRLKPMTHALSWEHPTGMLVAGTSTFPEILRDAGYHTAAFHSNPFLSRLFGFQKGFDVFYDDVLLGNGRFSERIELRVAWLQRLLRTDPYLGARELNARVLRWLATAQQPFFLWVHYMDVHGPYLKRKVLKFISPGERVWRKSVAHPERITRAEREKLLGSYHRQIRSLDAELGRFLQSMEPRAPAENRLTIVTADHGDEFGEHGGYSHGHKLYDELLHVPLIVALPGARPRRSSRIAELIQIAPTILEFAGCHAPAGLDAASLLPVVRETAFPDGKGYALSEGEMPPHDRISVRTSEWKLISEKGSPRELYHLPSDAAEKNNLMETRSGVFQELEGKINAHCQGASPDGAGHNATDQSTGMSAAEEQLVVQRLRDLGYME